MDLRQFERIQYGDQVVCQMLRGIATSFVGRIGRAMPALIVSDDPKTIFKASDLMEPHPFSARETVQQNDGRTVTGVCHSDIYVAG